MRRQSGFTLIETVIALSVVAILAGIVVPSLQGAVASARTASTRATIYESWMKGAAHSTTTGANVILCPGDSSGCRATTDWSQGWVVYADIDADGHRGTYDTLLQVAPALKGGIRMVSTQGRKRVVFQADGSNAGSNITWTLCDSRGPTKASTIVASNAGRLRAGTPTAQAVSACLAAP